MQQGAPSALPREGDVIAGKYRIERVVGEGAMGIVYAAHHLVLDQRVALKFLFVDSTEAGGETVERFVREAQAAARLRSEHVVRVTDAGSSDAGLPFLVMEYLEGCDLAELLKVDGPLPPAEVADYVLQVLAALAEAHAAGIVHRDLKPANLFLADRLGGRECGRAIRTPADRADHSPIIKILDFGISKQRSERAQWRELTGKTVLGTPAYISPEQLRSSKNVDPRADIWSLGVAMYELLSGALPFDGETPGELFAAILEQTAVPLRARKVELPEGWDDLLARCLKRDPQERFANVGALAEALAPLGSGRWTHLVPAIEEALTRSVRSLPQANAALVNAAVQAALASLPPASAVPVVAARAARASRSAGVQIARRHSLPPSRSTLATDKTILAHIVPQAAAERRRTRGRLPAMLAGVALALAACAGVAISARSAHGIRVAAARPAESSAVRPLPAAATSAVAVSEETARPAASAANPAPSASTSAPSPTPAKRRATPARKGADSKAAPDARPNFLRSWR